MKNGLDQTTDFSHKELYAFLNGNIPDFVKAASLPTEEELSKLADHSFADPNHRLFPIDSPANTFISHAYFINKQAELQKKWGKSFTDSIYERIKQAGTLHKQAEALEAYKKDFEKKATENYPLRYVFETKLPSGQDVALFPVRTGADLTKSAGAFCGCINNYPFEWRRAMCENFVKLAKEFRQDMPDIILKYANLFFPTKESTKGELKRRIKKVHPSVQDKYAALIADVDKAETREDFFKIASQAFELELSSGVYFNKAASVQVGDIVDHIFTLSVEKVAEMLNVVEMAGEYFPIPELQKISSDVYKQAFGCDIDPTNVNQLRDILPTMPLSDVALFKELSGIQTK